nr:MAG TPA: helix-turn-helix domain protein [Caudoviricetes sp.]
MMAAWQQPKHPKGCRGSQPQKGGINVPRLMEIEETPGVKTWEPCYNVEEAAEVLGVCRQRVLQMRNEKKLTGFSDGRKGSKSRLFFKVDDVEKYKLYKNAPKPLPTLRPVGVEKDSA